MFRIIAGLVVAFGYSAASSLGYVSNPWGPVLGKISEFNYEKADDESRYSFMFREASGVRSATNRLLAGTGDQIVDFEVDTARHRVTFLWRYPRGMQVNKATIRADTPRVLKNSCVSWSNSAMGRADVSWRFSYRNVRNQEVGSILLNPGTCHRYI